MDLQLRRVFFVLRHTTSPDLLSRAFAPSSDRATMSRAALAGWVERSSEFGEWPVKWPVEMTIAIDTRGARATRDGIGSGGGARSDRSRARRFRFRRRFGEAEPVEITRVEKYGDVLYQDNDISGWQSLDAKQADDDDDSSELDLDHARLRIRASYLSFDDVNFECPPRFHALHLQFDVPAPIVVSFSRAQLASPLIGVDPAPLLHGSFFKTLVLEYQLTLSLDTAAFRSPWCEACA